MLLRNGNGVLRGSTFLRRIRLTFYAHSTEDLTKANWQALQVHLEAVAKRAASYASHFGAAHLAHVTGLLHDLGKYTEAFQLRLSGESGRVDHSTWGARVARERYGSLGQLLAYSIAGHHAGLANGRDGGKRTALQDRLDSKPEHPLVSAWQAELSLPPAAELARLPGFKSRKSQVGFQQSFLGRMIFSCLVDADFLDTEQFYTSGQNRNSQHPTLEQLREQLNNSLSQFQPDTKLNQLRAEILYHVRRQFAESPGLFSLTVPTGGGKTLASLAFALDHAIHHGFRRVIFVIPFTSIVEQNAAVFRESLGRLGEHAVLEHHSAFVDDPAKAPAAREKIHVAMENWDAPIVVTTAVQFFESLFADRPSRCRKLHNIASSVVVLDEAQILPLKLLRPCVAALDELALNYRTSIVLCTATQPALKADDGFADGLTNVRELAPSPDRLYLQMKRVTVRHVGRLTQQDLINLLREHLQVLCIVNNRRHAKALYNEIEPELGARHLSTLMCAKHRSIALAEIRRLLQDGEPCRVVATSLIEAGVDVDFPCVLRAEAGLDSITQAAGRCNREGKHPPESSQTLIFSMEGDEWAPPAELKQFAQVFREVYRLHSGDPLSLPAIHQYFRQLYWHKGPLELDSHGLLTLLASSRVDSLPFETLAAQFRLIEDAQLPVIVPYDDKARSALSALDHVETCGGLARKLQPYIVPVPRRAHALLRDAAAIQPRAPSRFGDQFMELVNLDLYNNRLGLTWDNPTYIRAENLYH